MVCAPIYVYGVLNGVAVIVCYNTHRNLEHVPVFIAEVKHTLALMCDKKENVIYYNYM